MDSPSAKPRPIPRRDPNPGLIRPSLAAGRRDALASAAVEVLRLRDIALSDDVEQRLAGMELTREVLLAAATRCATEADFWARLTTND